MIKILYPQSSTYIPEELYEGILYISEVYGTATHLCPCGCLNKIVTPLSMWTLTKTETGVTLQPSIYSYQLKCKSHYWIINDKIVWAN